MSRPEQLKRCNHLPHASTLMEPAKPTSAARFAGIFRAPNCSSASSRATRGWISRRSDGATSSMGVS
jgi:hypothetical protein